MGGTKLPGESNTNDVPFVSMASAEVFATGRIYRGVDVVAGLI